MRYLVSLLILISSQSYALSFNKYCQYTQGEQDCSEEFLLALADANVTGESIVFDSKEVFVLESVNTESLELNNIQLIGISNGSQKPRIKTDRFHLVDINNLYIDNLEINGIHNDEGDEHQSAALVLLGSKIKSDIVSDITIQNTLFENAAETLLAVWNVRSLKLTQNTFRRSGLAMRVAYTESDPTDLRPRGNSAVFSGITDAIINFNELYEIKKNGLFFSGTNHNIYVLNNYIDMQNYEKPTQRYGLKGGAGIYIGNAPTFYNMLIQENRILNYKMNAIRMNGENIIVKKNYFNFSGQCRELDNGISDPEVGIAIKAHYLINSEIIDNCFQNSYTGIALDSWGEIRNVLVKKNIMLGLPNGVFASTNYGGSYSDITISQNTFYDALKYGITFFTDTTSEGNAVISNTFVNNDGPQQAPLISLRHQSNFYFAHNWMLAQARSQNWNFLTLLDVTDSVFKGSIFKSLSGEDRDFGGISILDEDSSNNAFYDLTFDKLNPGYIDKGVNNQFERLSYEN